VPGGGGPVAGGLGDVVGAGQQPEPGGLQPGVGLGQAEAGGLFLGGGQVVRVDREDLVQGGVEVADREPRGGGRDPPAKQRPSTAARSEPVIHKKILNGCSTVTISSRR
jgi:hypothetical protein